MRSYLEWIWDTVQRMEQDFKVTSIESLLPRKFNYRGIPTFKPTDPSQPWIIPGEFNLDVPSYFENRPPLLSTIFRFGPGFSPRSITPSMKEIGKDAWVESMFRNFLVYLGSLTRQVTSGSGIFSQKMTYLPSSRPPFNFIYSVSEPLEHGLRYTTPKEITFNLFPFKLYLTRPDYYGTLSTLP